MSDDARRQEAEAWVAQNVTSDPGCDHCERGAMAARCAYLAGRRAGEKAGEERVRKALGSLAQSKRIAHIGWAHHEYSIALTASSTQAREFWWALTGEGEPPKYGA